MEKLTLDNFVAKIKDSKKLAEGRLATIRSKTVGEIIDAPTLKAKSALKMALSKVSVVFDNAAKKIK